jgi:hypothetical protein
MIHYEGKRNEEGCHVTRVVGEKEHDLPLRLDLFDHSPTGFEWGYGGPAQLALALLADATGNDEKAVTLHQPFKWEVISRLPREGWQLLATDVVETAQILEQERSERNLRLLSGEEA